jgi:hypothetical protein
MQSESCLVLTWVISSIMNSLEAIMLLATFAFIDKYWYCQWEEGSVGRNFLCT